MQDYLKANTDKSGKRYKTHLPYSLSDQTIEARKINSLCYTEINEWISNLFSNSSFI